MKRHPALQALTIASVVAVATAGAVNSASAAETAAPAATDGITVTAGTLSIGLDAAGTVTSLVDQRLGENHLAADKQAPLVSLVIDGEQEVPTEVTQDGDTLVFSDDSAGYEIDVAIDASASYTTLEVVDVRAPEGADVESLLWGPLPTSITETVGETVGVVRDGDFAIGVRPLNDHTEGGWPQEYQDTGWQSEVEANPSSLEVAPVSEPLEEWSVAGVTPWGTVLRAFSFDYSSERLRSQPNGYQVPVGPLSDSTVVGSKLAVFGSTPSMVPTVLSTISKGESLPYPTIDGQWQKVAQATSQSFLVLGDLRTSNLDAAAKYAKAAGLEYLYSLPNAAGPWKATGHYEFDSSLGGSDAAVADFVDRADELGVKVGVHTLSDFVASNDAYVQPAPADERLALGGRAELTRPLSASANVLYLDDDTLLAAGAQGKKLRIGDEFIDYGSFRQVGEEWEVTGLSRGRWGSTPASHDSGASAARLLQNQYGGALGDLGIIDEISTRFADMWNDTGIRAMSFDGLESASQAGYGGYGIARMVNGTFAQIDDHDGFISETSRMTSNAWDGLSRASWGEVASTSMDQVFLNNAFYHANYLPPMMGWIHLAGNESLLSIESKLARAAGLDAGTGLQTSVGSLNGGGAQTTLVLDAIKQWETARNLGAFTAEQREALRDRSTNWHLTMVSAEREWSLQQLDASGAPIGDPQTVSVPEPAIITESLTDAEAGTLYGQVVASNSPATIRYEVTAGSLPKGLELNADTGGIIGIAEKPGSSRFTVTARGSAGIADSSKEFTLQVRPFTPRADVELEMPLEPSAPATVTVTNAGTHAMKNVRIEASAGNGWAISPELETVKKLDAGEAVTVELQLTEQDDASRTVSVKTRVLFDAPGSKDNELTREATLELPLADIAAAYNRVSISDDAAPRTANFDGSGNSYSAQALAAAGLVAGAEFEHDGLSFTWPSAVGAPNSVAGSATFEVSGDGTKLGLLGSAVGPQVGSGTITYRDGSTQPFEIAFNNWAGEEAEDAVVSSRYRNTPSGPANHGYFYRVFYDSVELDPAKEVYTITLPANGSMRVFSVAIG
ncbi:hypothetical protein JOE59_002406 [Agromyces cerinus]|uniref:Ig domain-containing protein n=1 Tax=Agromyces cerinus TaxID=33878 RepID=UPI0019578E27|nr:Ig domain-containing protein [Agromyces cerinus]MBM7831701.1 hypothetical protein [Agromyces cerinus]